MMKDTDKQLWLTGTTRPALRERFAQSGSLWARWCDHLCRLARQDIDWYGPYAVLAAAVTDEEQDRALARRFFQRYLAFADEALTSHEAQQHTHVLAAPLGRWAIYYDWMCELDLFSPEEHQRLRETMLRQASYFPAQQLAGRAPRFDNQVLANAFSVAAVGHVFGVRRGDDPLAQRLSSTGLQWLTRVLAQMPPGGYGGEGSAYQEHVVGPLTVFSGLLLEEATGRDVFRTGVAPGATPLRAVLDLGRKMVGPGGLVPGWDNYGFEAAMVKSPLAFLAGLDQDPRPLALIRDLEMWSRNDLSAWESDDRVWTLLWWPEDVAASDTAARFDPWMIEDVGGALQCAGDRIRLMQVWDACGGVPYSGRPQVDPNTITLEAFGSPLLFDSLGRIEERLLPMPAQAILDYLGPERVARLRRSLGAGGRKLDDQRLAERLMGGSIGYANALMIDGESWYVPLDERQGRGEALHHVGPLQVVRGDSTVYYTDRYDVTAMTRTSMLVDGRYVLVSDRVEADSAHRFTWQAFVREEASVADGRAVVTSPEQVRCDVIPLQKGDLATEAVERYAGRIGGRAVRLQHTPSPTGSGRIDVALVPQPLTEVVEDISGGWTRRIGDACEDAVSLLDAYLTDPLTNGDAPRRFERRLSLQPTSGKRYFLRLAMAGEGVRLRVNDVVIAPAAQHPPGLWAGSVARLAWLFDITAALHPGDNTVTFEVPLVHGETLRGPAELLVDRAPHTPSVQRLGTDPRSAAFRVEIDGRTDHVLLDRRGGITPWLDGETDARYAVRLHDGSLAAAEVASLRLGDGVTMNSTQPCDFAWSPTATRLAQLPDGSVFDLQWPEGSIHIECGWTILVTYRGKAAHALQLPPSPGRRVLVNGAGVDDLAGVEAADGMIPLSPACGSARRDGDGPWTAGEVFRLERDGGCGAALQLRAALHEGDWPVRVAAAEAIGRLKLVSLAGDLLSLLEAEDAGEPPDQPSHWWRWSKMLRARGNETPAHLPPLPDAVKQYRLKLALVAALGKLGDAAAVPVLERMFARGTDHFLVTSQLAVALGRLAGPSSLALLEARLQHPEINTQYHTRLAHDVLAGRIDRAAFERRVGNI